MNGVDSNVTDSSTSELNPEEEKGVELEFQGINRNPVWKRTFPREEILP